MKTPLLLFAMLLASTSVHAAVVATVPIGDPGNPAELDGIGSVPYSYRIGKYEVTNAQYANFLNSIAKNDPNELYDARMGSTDFGGILRTGAAGSYSYATKANLQNKPVNFVSFWDATRFANWLHNGMPAGPQGSSTTENGAYTLTASSIANNMVVRNAGAKWFLPSRDEWYKAAYYQPFIAGGDSSGYWDYATRTNLTPTAALASSIGDVTNPGSNVVNYKNQATWPGRDANVTTVGGAGPLSESYYGTADQTGNLIEWTESIVSGNMRTMLGGAFFFTDVNSAGQALGFPSNSGEAGGFRIAALIPEPASLFILATGSLTLLPSGRCKWLRKHSDTIRR